VRDRDSRDPAAWEAARGVCKTPLLVYRCWALGLILFYGGIYSNVIAVTPPLTLTREQAGQGLAIVDQALSDMGNGRFPDEKPGMYAGW
jgi:4-aminobutyrate aminotransferase